MPLALRLPFLRPH